MGREAFQEIDYRHMFGPMAKWVEQIDDPDRIPELVAAGVPRRHGRPARPGRARAAGGHARGGVRRGRRAARTSSRAWHRRRPTSTGRARCSTRAERPLAIVGGAPWSAEAHTALTAWLEARPHPGRRWVAAAGHRRQRLGCVRGTPHARRRPAADAAGARRRRPARDRGAAERDHDRGLHAVARARPGADADPRQPRPRGARSRLCAGRSRFPPRPTPLRSRSPRRRRSTGARARTRSRERPRRLPRQPPSPARAGRARHGRGDGRRCASGSPPTRSSRTAPATSPSGRIASTSSGSTRPSSRRRAAPWATAFQPR